MTLTTTSDSPQATGQAYLDRARAIGALISQEAENTEAGGTLSPAVVEALRAQNLFWMLAPTELGGGGVDARTALRVIQEIARADASAGWAFMVSTISPITASLNLPATTIEEFYAGDRKTITAGFGGPVGTARAVDGGYVIAAKLMPFGSGTLHADRIICTLKMTDEAGAVQALPDGRPDIRRAYIPADRIVFHGNWDVSGLRGSGSVDYELPEQFIEARYVTTLDAAARRHDPLLAFRDTGIMFLGHTAIALGIMQRGLEEVSRIAERRPRSKQGTLAEYPVFLHEYAVQEASFHGARAYAEELVTGAQDEAESHGSISPTTLARMHQVATWAHGVAGGVLDFCYSWVGSDPIRMPSPLGRAFRDLRIARNHAIVDPSALEAEAPLILADWLASDGGAD